MSVIFKIHFQQYMFFFLFDLIVLLRLIGLLSKSAFVTKFARANLAAKFFAVSLLNSGVVKYLSWS